MDRILQMSKQEKRWFDNIKKAFYESDLALSQNKPEDRCIQELCKAIDTAKTLARSLRGDDNSSKDNRAGFLAFLQSELPSPKDGGLAIKLLNSKTGKEKTYSFAELVYDIRCMIHENENLNAAEEVDYHILIDWSRNERRVFGCISEGKIVCNGYLVWRRLREILSKYITFIDSAISLSINGSFNTTICPDICSIKPDSIKPKKNS